MISIRSDSIHLNNTVTWVMGGIGMILAPTSSVCKLGASVQCFNTFIYLIISVPNQIGTSNCILI